MMHEPIGIPACFSSGEKLTTAQYNHPAPPPTTSTTTTTTATSTTTLTRSASGSPQSLIMSVYRTKIANHSRLITVTWCKNLLLHGLSVSVDGPDGHDHYHCKVELKPWYFWRKQESKQFMVDGTIIGVVWDLKAAKFNGEVEPQSDYYVAIVYKDEVALVLGDMKKDAFRRTGCRPSLVDPVLVSRKEHVFGKKRFSTKVKFHERGKCHEISVECNNSNYHSLSPNNNNNNDNNININNNKGGFEGLSPMMDIKIDGELATQVKHLQWKFRGNESIDVKETKLEVYWDVHDWLFGSGPRHAMFLFKASSSSSSSKVASSSSSSLSSLSSHVDDHACATAEKYGKDDGSSPEFCLFLYAWKVE